MKIGKISQTVLKRSVLKYLKSKREEVLVGPGIGEDSCALDVADDLLVMSTEPFVLTVKDGKLEGAKGAVYRVVNNLAVSNATPLGIMLSILLPLEAEEGQLQQLIKEADEVCKQLNIQIIGGHTEVTPAVNCPVVTITGVGTSGKETYLITKGVAPGEDLIVTKWIALEGTSVVTKEREEELCSRYPKQMVDTAKAFDAYISVLPEAQIAAKMGASAMHDITNGGIFAALWELAEASGVGLEVDLKKIPVKQETIEVCNQLDLNPYELSSGGSLLIATKAGVALVEALQQVGIPATIVGTTKEGNGRIIRNGEEARYLEPPKSDQIYKLEKENYHE